MNRGRLPTGFLSVVIIAQILVPVRQIAVYNTTLRHGTVYHFKADIPTPSDLLQGQTFRLRYHLDYPDHAMIHPHATYGALGVNADGFAELTEIRMTKPDTGTDYVRLYMEQNSPRLFFDRYHVRRPKSGDRPVNGGKKAISPNTPVRVVVRVYRGHGVIENIMVDGRPLSEVMTD